MSSESPIRPNPRAPAFVCEGLDKLIEKLERGPIPRCRDRFPLFDDVQSFDGLPWRGKASIITGGFPCQDISSNNTRAKEGLDGPRSGLWRSMARIVGEVRPRYVLVENSPALAARGLGRVLGDLAALGFDAEWSVLSARALGAPHGRERLWILGYTDSGHGPTHRPPARADAPGSCAVPEHRAGVLVPGSASRCDWGLDWPPEPDLGRVADGVAARVDRLKALGNGQVPRVAAAAFTELRARALGRTDR